ncbi:MAG TPA: hypothetical protein VMR90_01355 [Candidatus Cybelea sp.]|nr:hypothetical protein [Candidatus Cybelea sp.]
MRIHLRAEPWHRERSETDAGLCADEQGVVLAVSIGAGDQPVVRDGVEEGAYVFRCVC